MPRSRPLVLAVFKDFRGDVLLLWRHRPATNICLWQYPARGNGRYCCKQTFSTFISVWKSWKSKKGHGWRSAPLFGHVTEDPASLKNMNRRENIKELSTAISRWKYRFSSDHRSQAASSPVSTWMGDRLGIPGAVDFFHFFFFRRHRGCAGRQDFFSYLSHHRPYW